MKDTMFDRNSIHDFIEYLVVNDIVDENLEIKDEKSKIKEQTFQDIQKDNGKNKTNVKKRKSLLNKI